MLEEQIPPSASATRGDVTGLDRGHPLARVLWDLLRDRSMADKALVLNACDRRLGRGDTTEKQEQALHALSLFVAEQDRVPHAAEWDEWRRSDPVRAGLPSATFLRNAFGGWPGVRAAWAASSGAGTVPEVDVLSARLTAKGSAFSDEELLGAVRSWGATVEGVLYLNDFQRWLNRQHALGSAGPRVPRFITTFRRLGSFGDLLAAAGLAHRASGRARLGQHRTRGIALPPETVAAQRDALRAELVQWSREVRGALRSADFLVHWQSLTFEPEHPLAMVSASDRSFRRLVGSWDAALLDAGLITSPTFGSSGRPSTRPAVVQPLRQVRHSDVDELFAWLRLAADEFGPGVSYPEYDRWRKERLERAAETGQPLEPIPSSARFKKLAGGSWFDAKVMAGIPGAEELAAERRDRRIYPREELLDAVASAVRAHADELVEPTGLLIAHYKRWRAKEVASVRAAGQRPHVPTFEVVRRELGGPAGEWLTALRTVTAERPELAECFAAEPMGDERQAA